MERIEKEPVILGERTLTIERFKAEKEKKTESSCIFFRAFARPLTIEELNNEISIHIYEYGWKL
jgi:polyadenylate-binding protein